ncbi:MAG: hypothetical protein QM610_00155 [Chitinophagaceae bacterium]
MANVELSDEEIAVVRNAGFLLTKNKAIHKLQQALGDIAVQYQRITHNGQPAWRQRCIVSPKISKGEQYAGLPYLMLDYPRTFSHGDTFAVRSFFWWGNYFSISLLLTGESQRRLLPGLCNNPLLGDWHIDTSSTPWRHDWNKDTSPQLSAISNWDVFLQEDFFKISKQLALSQWQDMEQFFVDNFQQLWKAINCPDDGTSL